MIEPYYNAPSESLKPSLQQRWLLLFALIGLLLIMVGVFVVNAVVRNNNEQQLIQQSQQWSSLVTAIASPYLAYSDKAQLLINQQQVKQQLLIFSSFPTIEHIHVYWIEPRQQTLMLFASYSAQVNQKQQPAIPILNQSLLAQALTPIISNDTMRISYKITRNNELIGYVYLHINVAQIYQQQFDFIWLLIVLALMLWGFIVYLFVRVFRVVTQEVEQIGFQLTEVTQNQRAELTNDALHYSEFDWLHQKINLLIKRLERQVVKYQKELQLLRENTNKLEEKLNRRTEALKESNNELLTTLETLHQYQNQLVESEKMASLGDMVAGVAHEVNTPVGLSITASSLLADNLSTIKQAFENKTLKSSELKRFLADGEENIQIIMRNLKRAADLITTFKQVAVDQSSEETRCINMRDLLNEVIMTLAPELKNSPYHIVLNCPDELVVESKPGALNQILVNLIMNSIKHGFEGRDTGTITIDVMPLGQQLHICYQDDGKGVDPMIKNRIFEPFITTKRGAGGSGLGLHLVYNIVTQGLLGTIHFESEPNQGVKFDIDIPLAYNY
jgi:signal transduction histidine kinase